MGFSVAHVRVNRFDYRQEKFEGMASCSNRSVRAMKDGQVAAEVNQIVSPVPSFHADSDIDGSIGNNSPVKASDNDASRPSLKVVID